MAVCDFEAISVKQGRCEHLTDLWLILSERRVCDFEAISVKQGRCEHLTDLCLILSEMY